MEDRALLTRRLDACEGDLCRAVAMRFTDRTLASVDVDLVAVRRWFEKLRDRVEDLFALVFWDGASWKAPRKDRRNGL
jgi:hypothetical protein